MKITEAGEITCCGRVISWRDNEEFPEDTGNAVGILFDEIRRSWSASTPATGYALAGSAVGIANNLLKKLEEETNAI